MRRLAYVMGACLSMAACDLMGPDDEDENEPRFRLEVTERSATTLTLRWPSMGDPDTYTVDYLTGVAKCEDWPPHNDVLHVTGTTVQITALTPATRYHIHVHLLPQANDRTTNVVFISTLPAGSEAQAVTPADYESCAGQG